MILQCGYLLIHNDENLEEPVTLWLGSVGWDIGSTFCGHFWNPYPSANGIWYLAVKLSDTFPGGCAWPYKLIDTVICIPCALAIILYCTRKLSLKIHIVCTSS